MWFVLSNSLSNPRQRIVLFVVRRLFISQTPTQRDLQGTIFGWAPWQAFGVAQAAADLISSIAKKRRRREREGEGERGGRLAGKGVGVGAGTYRVARAHVPA